MHGIALAVSHKVRFWKMAHNVYFWKTSGEPREARIARRAQGLCVNI